jgi:hypothetical protein
MAHFLTPVLVAITNIVHRLEPLSDLLFTLLRYTMPVWHQVYAFVEASAVKSDLLRGH